MWTNAEGMAGIAVHAFHGKSKAYSEDWLLEQQEVASDKPPADKRANRARASA